MTAEEMVKKYDIVDYGDGRIMMRNHYAVKKDNAMGEIKAMKSEIMAYLRAKAAETAAKKEMREAKIAAIDGLDEIKNAIYDMQAYHKAFNRMMDDEYNDGVNPPQKPQADIKFLEARYPRAAAYIQAENMSYAANDVKASAGKRAMECIINGGDYTAALADANKEWSDYCDKHLFD